MNRHSMNIISAIAEEHKMCMFKIHKKLLSFVKAVFESKNRNENLMSVKY